MILHLVRCDSCKADTPMDAQTSVSTVTQTVGANGFTYPQAERLFSVPPAIKQIDGRHFCSWACVANYAETRQGDR